MARKYCRGSARLSETVFGWKRRTVALGLAEKRSGIICVGAQSGFSGSKRWEEREPEAAAALRQLAEAHAQQDPTFESTIAYTRLTVAEAINQMSSQGFSKAQLPSPSTMAEVLNPMGYRLRKVVKAKPKKKLSGQLQINFGSSYKTSDFIVDTLEQWWKTLTNQEQEHCQLIQLKVDNGPESSGVRTEFLNPMVKFADTIGKAVQLLYYRPYHSKYNPIERCWGILEQHWNGAKLTDVETMLSWAQSMKWKGLNPIINLNKKVYEKGLSLSKKAMKAIEKRLKRDPLLPKWDILIQPV